MLTIPDMRTVSHLQIAPCAEGMPSHLRNPTPLAYISQMLMLLHLSEPASSGHDSNNQHPTGQKQLATTVMTRIPPARISHEISSLMRRPLSLELKGTETVGLSARTSQRPTCNPSGSNLEVYLSRHRSWNISQRSNDAQNHNQKQENLDTIW